MTSAAGILILPEPRRASAARVQRLALDGGPPAGMRDRILAEIARRYGEATADFVRLQLEYPR